MKDVEIKVNGDDFILVDAESLSLDDEFMQYKPQTEREIITQLIITRVISSGVKNFYRPKCDPSFIKAPKSVKNILRPNKSSKRIRFILGKMPAVGKSYNWWQEVARNYCPEHNSRLGTRLEYYAFLGVLIKKIIGTGKSAEWAWNAVCNDTDELGHYWINSLTGSRDICVFYNLSRTRKIFAEDIDEGGFWVTGSYYNSFGYDPSPLASLSHCTWRYEGYNDSVGWLVLDA